MKPKLGALARAVACLAVALTPLGAAPIHHANYRSEATLTSAPVTCSQNIGFDSHGEPRHAGFGCSSTLGDRGPYFGTIGSFSYDDLPDSLLPAGSRVLQADLHQWGYFEFEKFSEGVSVTPIDNTQPYYAEHTDYEIRSGGSYSDSVWPPDWYVCELAGVVYSGPVLCGFDSRTDWTEPLRSGLRQPRVQAASLHVGAPLSSLRFSPERIPGSPRGPNSGSSTPRRSSIWTSLTNPRFRSLPPRPSCSPAQYRCNSYGGRSRTHQQ